MPNRAFVVAKLLVNPTLTSVTPTGGAAASITYKIVGIDQALNPTAASAGVTDAVAPTTLDGTHFETLAWTDPVGVAFVDIYRTAGGPSQGKIGRVAAGVQTFVDNGLVGDGTTAPAANTTGNGTPIGIDDLDDINVQVDGTFVATIQIQGQIDGGSTWFPVGTAATAPALVNAATTFFSKLRAKMTAYTSGTPIIFAGGHKRPA